MPDQTEQQPGNEGRTTAYAYKERTAETLSTGYEIFLDFILVAFLLLTLSLIHIYTNTIHVSEWFKEVFSKVHEAVVMGNYLMLAYKSLVRLWNHT